MPKEPRRFKRVALSEAASALNEVSRDLKNVLAEELGEAGDQVASSLAASLQKVAASLDDVASGVRPSAKAERTKQALLDAAAKVISAKGYEGASVGDIAEAAGFTKGAIYAHFGSKEELFVELAHAHGLLACDLVESADTGGLSFVDWYADRALAAFEAAGAQDDALVLIGVELACFALRHPEYREEMADYENTAIRAMARRVYADRAGVVLGPDEEVPRADLVTVLGIMAVSNELLIQCRLGTAGADAQAVRELIHRIARS